MTIVIDVNKCNSCGECVKYCPGDLIVLDKETKKAYIREERDCWDCFVCVKVCKPQALTVKLPYSIANYKATLVPEVGEGNIKWTLTDCNGKKEVFVIKTLEV